MITMMVVNTCALLSSWAARASARRDVLVVVEGVVGVVRGLDLGESPVDLIAVGLSNPAGAVVGVEEVDVDAAGAVRLKGLRGTCCAQAVSAAACSPASSGSHTASMIDVVGYVATGVGGGVVGDSGDGAAHVEHRRVRPGRAWRRRRGRR